MTEKFKSLRDSAAARWSALLIVSLTMMMAYFFTDVMGPLEAPLTTKGQLIYFEDGTYLSIDSLSKVVVADDFNAQNIAEADLADLFDTLRLPVVIADKVHHRNQRFAAKQINCGIRLGVAADLYDPFAQRCQCRRKITCNGGFTDTALAVNSYFLHIKLSQLFFLSIKFNLALW